jgi:hypothetical protein
VINFINTYPYFIISLYFLVIWIVVFLFRGGNGKEIILIGFGGAILGPAVQYMHLQDWWNPNFLLDYPVKIEDIIFGFSIAGISSALYEELFKVSEIKRSNILPSKKYIAVLLFTGYFLLFGLFFLFDAHSYNTSVMAAIGIGFLISYKRHDLITPIFITSIVLSLISIPIYLILLEFNELMFQEQWFMENLSNNLIWGIPIEELTWYLVVGIAFSCIYEFVYGIKFIKHNIKDLDY